MQRDAAAVSIVRGERRVGSFAKRQQLAEGAPLMRKPLDSSDKMWTANRIHLTLDATPSTSASGATSQDD